MQTLVVLALSNFTVTFLLVALAVALAGMARAPKPLTRRLVTEKLLFWYLFFGVGLTFLFNGVMHAAFSDMTAKFIGWANSPFQLEVGYASFGFAAVGFLACWRGFDMRLAAILGPALFLWGAAAGHVRSMVADHNFAPGNAGSIFWTDIITPLLGFLLLWLRYRGERARSA